MRARGKSSSLPRRGQHFLADRSLAADIVRNAGVVSSDHVVEIGAGTGLLTRELARSANQVDAIEIDPRLAALLRSRFDGTHVRVLEADARRVALPREPFRVIGNLPFHLTTDLLRHLLDDPQVPLLRADVIVQWGAAVKRARQRPSTLLSLGWTPWFEFTISRLIRRTGFRPPPSVDAAVLTITRRPDPLLDPRERDAFMSVLRTAFGDASRPVRVTVGVGRRALVRRGVAPDARPIDLDVAEWVEVFRLLRNR